MAKRQQEQANRQQTADSSQKPEASWTCMHVLLCKVLQQNVAEEESRPGKQGDAAARCKFEKMLHQQKMQTENLSELNKKVSQNCEPRTANCKLQTENWELRVP